MNTVLDAVLFPRERHPRGPDPGSSSSRGYKPHLQREFRRKCVYCRVSDGLKGYEAFGVDHYLPRSKFPDLVSQWSNLFYACNVCNTWKGEAVSTPERFLPNPCEHRMADHLQYRHADIEAYTPHGEWLVELLHLRERRSLREFILFALGRFLAARSDLLRELTAYEARRAETTAGEEASSLAAAIRETNEDLDRVDQQIERLIGESVRDVIPAAARLE